MRRITSESVIAKRPPNDGRDWDNQCARCGSSVYQHDEDFYGVCMSSPDWCNSHPLPGRKRIKRGQIEWFTFDKLKRK